VVPPTLGVKPALPVRREGVVGRFLYADAGIMGGPIAPGVVGDNVFAAAAMTSLWSEGSGGGEPARDRMLLELPGRLGTRPSFECLLLGEGGGDEAFSTPAELTAPEYRGFRANRSLSICSADTMVWVPSSAMSVRGLLEMLELIAASGARVSLAATGSAAV
jgi:hypothetical protein